MVNQPSINVLFIATLEICAATERNEHIVSHRQNCLQFRKMFNLLLLIRAHIYFYLTDEKELMESGVTL